MAARFTIANQQSLHIHIRLIHQHYFVDMAACEGPKDTFFFCQLLNGRLLRLKASNIVREFSRGFAAAWQELGAKFTSLAFNFYDPNMFELV